MNDALKSYIEQYNILEAGMRELINRKGNSLCGQCTRCCCDVIHCTYAMESPFLKMVHQQEEFFDHKEGFLTPSGCALEKGRPSICYEYFCDDHFYNQPDELHAEILKIIGSLLNHATRNAQGAPPLEDILQEEELDQLDFQQLNKQLNESLQALEIIHAFYREGNIEKSALHTLRQIHLGE
ncbi:MAG: hypothetical protein V3V05_00825 [Pontiella sp.]